MFPRTVDQHEVELDAMAQAQYQRLNRMFTPMYPWVFVRVLSREQRTEAGIVLPAHEQNKTIHEGIVLSTWAPKILTNGEVVTTQLTLGDHVIFPHWAGLPVEGYSDVKYRVVKEVGWKQDGEGGIYGVIDYNGMSDSTGEVLRSIVADPLRPLGMVEGQVELVAEIEKRFLLVDRQRGGVTLSGR